MTEINLGLLAAGPHADLIRHIAMLCRADSTLQAAWVGGSLATGTGDIFSDIDLRVAVEPGTLDLWNNPEWPRYVPLKVLGGTFLKFGDRALLHHLLLDNGTLLDFYVQDTTQVHPDPEIVILFCRDPAFRQLLATVKRPTLPQAGPLQAAAVRQFLVDYWITTHKEVKGLSRRYDHAHFVGLYFERLALLRAWYMLATGTDANARVSIHLLGIWQRGLEGHLSTAQLEILGLPTRTPEEAALAIEAIRAEMSRVGRLLADQVGFDYPQEAENVVTEMWNRWRTTIVDR